MRPKIAQKPLSVKIRYGFETLLIIILFALFKLMPAAWASNCGGFIGRNLGPKLAASRKALRNLKNALPDANHDQIITDMWDNLGRTFAEYPHLQKLARDNTEIIGLEHLTNTQNQASVLFAAHLGNWEICPIAAALQANYDVHSIYRPPNNPIADYLLMKCRNLGGRLKPIPKATSAMRDVMTRLKDNQHLGFLIDQKYNKGVATDFFHAPAMVSPAYIQLAQKFDCPLIPAQIERINNSARFRLTLHPPVDTRGKSQEELLTLTHAMLENWITQNPAQWLWLHRRWDSAHLMNKYETVD